MGHSHGESALLLYMFHAGRMLGAVVCSLSLLVMPQPGWSAHGSWIDGYRGLGGSPCCGHQDCRPVHARLLRQTAAEMTLEVDGVEMTVAPSVVHASEDGQDWWCAIQPLAPIMRENTRCIFIFIGT